jgi:prophage regulatory protein
LLNKSLRPGHAADRGQTGIHLQTERALQDAVQELAVGIRELVKEAVREALTGQVAPKVESPGATQDQPEVAPLPRDAFIRVRELKRLTGLSQTTIYKLLADRAFPEPFKLGERSVAWRWGEVLDWMNSRPRARSQPTIGTKAQ